MLPAPSRLHTREDFALAVRRGRRVAGDGLVLHHRLGDELGPPRIGFIVGRGVGNAVTRNRVRRQLRHASSQRLDRVPSGARVVVRAMPTASTKTFDQLAATVDALFERAFATAGQR